jgi:hypothetical protein
MINPSQRPLPDNTQHSQQTNIHARRGIRIHSLRKRAAEGLRLRPRGHCDRLIIYLLVCTCLLFWLSYLYDNFVCESDLTVSGVAKNFDARGEWSKSPTLTEILKFWKWILFVEFTAIFLNNVKNVERGKLIFFNLKFCRRGWPHDKHPLSHH